VFFLHHECRRPLKIGILADLAPLVSCSEEELKAVLNKYVRSDGYLLACTEGAPRIDLEGNAVDTVSAKHAAHAQKVLAERERWRLKKKAARERQQPKKAADKERTARQSARCCTRAAARAATHTTAANTKAG
jgi:ProP effector